MAMILTISSYPAWSWIRRHQTISSMMFTPTITTWQYNIWNGNIKSCMYPLIKKSHLNGTVKWGTIYSKNAYDYLLSKNIIPDMEKNMILGNVLLLKNRIRWRIISIKRLTETLIRTILYRHLTYKEYIFISYNNNSIAW